MRIAIPLVQGQVSQHFGHCEKMLFVDADREQRKITGRRVEKAPEHVPGLLPRWLQQQGVDVVIAGGIGARARDLLAQASVQVLTGISTSDPDAAVNAFLAGELQSGPNGCDHSGGGCHH